MPLFSNNNNNNKSKETLNPRGLYNDTADRRSPSSSPRGSKRGGEDRSKSPNQREPATFKEQAVMYGMDLKSKRDQDAKERLAIEQKMAKRSGKKIPKSTGGMSRRDEAKTVFKIANFFRKQK